MGIMERLSGKVTFESEVWNVRPEQGDTWRKTVQVKGTTERTYSLCSKEQQEHEGDSGGGSEAREMKACSPHTSQVMIKTPAFTHMPIYI